MDNHRKEWLEPDTNYLKGNYKTKTQEELINTLNRNWLAIKQKAHKLGLLRHKSPEFWTDEKTKILR